MLGNTKIFKRITRCKKIFPLILKNPSLQELATICQHNCAECWCVKAAPTELHIALGDSYTVFYTWRHKNDYHVSLDSDWYMDNFISWNAFHFFIFFLSLFSSQDLVFSLVSHDTYLSVSLTSPTKASLRYRWYINDTWDAAAPNNCQTTDTILQQAFSFRKNPLGFFHLRDKMISKSLVEK